MHTCVLAVVCFVKKMFTNSMTILLKFSWIKENAYGTGFSVLFLSDFIKIHDTRVVTHERIDTKFLSNVHSLYIHKRTREKDRRTHEKEDTIRSIGFKHFVSIVYSHSPKA